MVVMQEKQPIPLNVKLVISFLFLLCCCQLIALFLDCIQQETGREALFLDIIFHAIFSLLTLLLVIQLILRAPFSRTCALMLFLFFPVIKGISYVVSPLSWQRIELAGRIQEIVSAVIFLSMAGLLLFDNVTVYLKQSRPTGHVPDEENHPD